MGCLFVISVICHRVLAYSSQSLRLKHQIQCVKHDEKSVTNPFWLNYQNTRILYFGIVDKSLNKNMFCSNLEYNLMIPILIRGEVWWESEIWKESPILVLCPSQRAWMVTSHSTESGMNSLIFWKSRFISCLLTKAEIHSLPAILDHEKWQSMLLEVDAYCIHLT